MITDTRAERGGVFQELVGSEDAEKIRTIGPVTALLSGNETDADELLTICEDAIRAFSVSIPVDESDIAITKFLSGLREAAAQRKEIMVDHHLDMTISMSFDDFVRRHRNEFVESHSRDIWNQIDHIDLGADVLLCGFTGDDQLIVRLDRYGKTHWETNYSVIGVGSDIAHAFLCQRDWMNEEQGHLDLADCLYRIYEAKRASQKNRHVGETSVFQVLFRNGKRADITDDCFKRFKETYAHRLELEPFKFSTDILKWDEDEGPMVRPAQPENKNTRHRRKNPETDPKFLPVFDLPKKTKKTSSK